MSMRGKRGKDKKSTGWIRDTLIGIYTQDQLRKDWEAVTPAERLKLVGSWVPKEMKVDSNTEIRLIINGLQQVKSIDASQIQALPAHDDDDTA